MSGMNLRLFVLTDIIKICCFITDATLPKVCEKMKQHSCQLVCIQGSFVLANTKQVSHLLQMPKQL
jgi:hypothetical protein